MTFDRLKRALSPSPEHPVTLAMLRLAVCALVLLSPEVRNAPTNAAFPAALRVAPEGLGWFLAYVPIGPRWALAAQLGIALGAFAGLAGYRARLAMGMVAVFGFYLFGLAQLEGAVVHDMHLIWFATLLAASPCGDALSLAREPSRGPAPARSMAYTWPLVMARALFAAVYFFPGLWKLRQAGLAWALSDNLRNQMYAKWFEYGGFVPFVRVDEHPALLRLAALGVLALELGFPLLMLSRRTRVVAALGGIAFHLAGDAFLRISFPSLWVCYVALVDWGPLADRLRRRADAAAATRTATSAESPAAAALMWPKVVGGVLVVAAVVQGLRGSTFAWPFACYPTFQFPASTELPDLVLEADLADGRTLVMDSGGNGRGRTQDRWATVWALAGLTHGPPSHAALVAYWNASDPGRARSASRGRALRVTWSVLPEDRDRPPRARTVIDTFVLDLESGQAR